MYPALDFNGVTRPSPPAIGAFEFGGGSSGEIVTLAAAPNPAMAGQAVTLTATLAQTGSSVPTGTITFLNGSASLGQASLNGEGTATLVVPSPSAGSYEVTASYSGDSNYPASVSREISLEIQSATTTILAASPNPVASGQPLALTATVAAGGGAAPSGTVNFLNGAKVLGTATLNASGIATLSTSALAAGTYSLTAQYVGNASSLASNSSAVSVTVTPSSAQSTTTSLVAAPNPVVAGQALALNATVTGSSGTTPSGTVNFLNGAKVLGTATLNSSGIATLSTSALAAGTYSLTAQYVGNASSLASNSSAVSVTVTPSSAQSTTSTLVASQNPIIVGQALALTATVTGTSSTTPAGTVNFLSGSTLLASGTLNASGAVTVSTATLGAGTYTLTAQYVGNGTSLTSTSTAITEVVGLIPTATNLRTTPTNGANSQSSLVANVQNSDGAVVMPAGTVTFTSGATTIGTATVNAEGVATLTPELGSGSFNVVAAYSGDSTHSPSTSVAIPVTGVPPSFTIGINPTTLTVAAPESATINVSLKSISGFKDKIALKCLGLPPGVSCDFSSINVSLSANGTQSTQLVIATSNTQGGGSSAMNNQPGKRAVNLAGLFIPFGLLLGWTVGGFRKRHAGVLSMVLVMLTSAAMLATGCGGFAQSAAAPGAYVIQVAGTGTSTGMTQYQSFTLDVSK
jgi:hypothetical protein